MTGVTVRKASHMKQLSTGSGLAVLGLSAIACVILSVSRFGSGTQAFANSPATTAIATAALAQTTPTIVWYGAVHNNRFAYVFNSSGCGSSCERASPYTVLLRAWSNGTVEAKKICTGDDCGGGFGTGAWQVVSAANLGLNAWADLDLNEEVDPGDLSMVLLNFGDAPRQDIPPSDCPLNLINPQ